MVYDSDKHGIPRIVPRSKDQPVQNYRRVAVTNISTYIHYIIHHLVFLAPLGRFIVVVELIVAEKAVQARTANSLHLMEADWWTIRTVIVTIIDVDDRRFPGHALVSDRFLVTARAIGVGQLVVLLLEVGQRRERPSTGVVRNCVASRSLYVVGRVFIRRVQYRTTPTD